MTKFPLKTCIFGLISLTQIGFIKKIMPIKINYLKTNNTKSISTKHSFVFKGKFKINNLKNLPI